MKPADDVIRQLRREAMEVIANAYSPYSRFRVGAAVLAGSGAIYSGCNVENVSYGLTQCAERVALTSAIAAGEQAGSLQCLLLYIPGETAHAPCGACRQVMQELMAPDSVLVSCCDTDEVRSWTVPEYLPDAFVAPY
ncbi:MAG: cytidine deaminase [Lysobacterales bacterium]|jgi:cytidine deaminase